MIIISSCNPPQYHRQSNEPKLDDYFLVPNVVGHAYSEYEKTLEPTATDEIRLMLWTDYDTIPNAMQNTYFYGTLRIYAWQEIKVNI